MGLLQNFCKPAGLAGKFMVKMMNNGHAKIAEWGFSHITAVKAAPVLDVGCGIPQWCSAGASWWLWLPVPRN